MKTAPQKTYAHPSTAPKNYLTLSLGAVLVRPPGGLSKTALLSPTFKSTQSSEFPFIPISLVVTNSKTKHLNAQIHMSRSLGVLFFIEKESFEKRRPWGKVWKIASFCTGKKVLKNASNFEAHVNSDSHYVKVFGNVLVGQKRHGQITLLVHPIDLNSFFHLFFRKATS